MSTKLISLVLANYVLLARSLVIILGCASVWWGVAVFPAFWQDSSIERVARRVIAGEKFKVETLSRQMSVIDDIEREAFCRPAAIRSAAAIRLRLVEEQFLKTKQSPPIAKEAELQTTLQKALACAPSDSFLWLALFWSMKQNPISPKFEYLRLSYELGPNEGWIALKRNPLAFELFEELPADLKESVLSEFTRLLSNDFEPNSGLYTAVLNIFIGPAWHVREKITPRLAALSKRVRQNFAKALHEKGYSVTIPDTETSY